MYVVTFHYRFKMSLAHQGISKRVCESSSDTLQAEEIISLLRDIRQDTSRLEGVLTLMRNEDNSSLPLFPILFMMLQIQPSMRPTAK